MDSLENQIKETVSSILKKQEQLRSLYSDKQALDIMMNDSEKERDQLLESLRILIPKNIAEFGVHLDGKVYLVEKDNNAYGIEGKIKIQPIKEINECFE